MEQQQTTDAPQSEPVAPPDQPEPRVRKIAQTRELSPADYAELQSPLAVHEFARDYPLLPVTARPDRPHETTLTGIGKSMVDRGLDYPITLYRESMSHPLAVLDGQNRAAAGRLVGYAFTREDFVEFVGSRDEALDYVDARNSLRRDMDEDQRAALAVKREPIYAERARRRQLAGIGQAKPDDSGEKGRAIHTSADAQGVSRRKAETMKGAALVAPETVDPVIRGEMKVAGAVKIAKAKKAQAICIHKESVGVCPFCCRHGVAPHTCPGCREKVPRTGGKQRRLRGIGSGKSETEKEKADAEAQEAARVKIAGAIIEFETRPNHIWSQPGGEEWDGKKISQPLLSARWCAMGGKDDMIALEARTLRSDQKPIIKKDGGVANTFWISGRELKALVEAIEQDQKPKPEPDPDGEAA